MGLSVERNNIRDKMKNKIGKKGPAFFTKNFCPKTHWRRSEGPRNEIFNQF